jgi:hypothetical protein
VEVSKDFCEPKALDAMKGFYVTTIAEKQRLEEKQTLRRRRMNHKKTTTRLPDFRDLDFDENKNSRRETTKLT